VAIALPIQLFERCNYNSHSEFRKSIEQHLKAVLKERSVINNETKIQIQFNKVGIEKIVSTIGDIKAVALCNLQLVLTNALYAEKQDDKKNRPDIIRVLLFKTVVTILENEYEVWCYIRQRSDGYFLYSLNIDTKKTL
jgi:rRNA pseudouridine-1189 N-methylase Emg1 (Nep1/Mra1 family)